MANIAPAPAGTNIVVLDRDDRSVYRVPVVCFDVLSTMAYPVCAVAFRGLLKAERALEMNGLIMDRGFPIPFDSEEAWVMWAMSVEAGDEADEEIAAYQQTRDNGPGPAEPEVIHASVNETTETVQETATRLRAENGTAGHTDVTGRAPKPRKTFSSKSFWSRTNTQGVLEIVEIDGGLGLPRDTEGFEKIKRDEYAAFKKQAKGGDESVLVIGWDDGPVLPGSHEEEVIEQESTETDADDDFGGLV